MRFIDFNLRANVAHSQFRPRLRDFCPQNAVQCSWAAWSRPYDKGASCDACRHRSRILGLPLANGVRAKQRNIRGRRHGLAQIAIVGVSDNANDFETPARHTVAGFLLKPLSNGISAAEALLHECFVNDCRSWEVFVCAKIAPLNEGNPHRVEEAGRNRQEVSQHFRGLSIYPDEAIPAISIEEWPSGHRYPFDARNTAQPCRRFVPYFRRLSQVGGSRQNHHVLRGIASGSVSESFKGGYKQSSGEINHKTKCHLCGDKGQH